MHLLETLSHLFHPQRSNNHRPGLLHPESLLSLAGLAVGFSLFVVFSGAFNPELGSILGYASNITSTDVVIQTNAERAKAGLAPLELNEKLSQAAAGKAQDMFTKQYWAHQSPDGVEPWAFITGAGYAYTAAGENLARDFTVTPDMMAAWMASPTHAANIMNARYEEIGVAVVNGTLEGMETTLVVQMFGRPTVQPVQAQIPAEAVTTSPQPTTIAVAETQSLTLAEVPQVMTESVSPVVLADTAVPIGSVTPTDVLLSPLQLTKAFSLSIVIIIVATLVMDWYISHKKGTVRLVGNNFAHILYLAAICFIVVLFKGGFVF